MIANGAKKKALAQSKLRWCVKAGPAALPSSDAQGSMPHEESRASVVSGATAVKSSPTPKIVANDSDASVAKPIPSASAPSVAKKKKKAGAVATKRLAPQVVAKASVKSCGVAVPAAKPSRQESETPEASSASRAQGSAVKAARMSSVKRKLPIDEPVERSGTNDALENPRANYIHASFVKPIAKAVPKAAVKTAIDSDISHADGETATKSITVPKPAAKKTARKSKDDSNSKDESKALVSPEDAAENNCDDFDSKRVANAESPSKSALKSVANKDEDDGGSDDAADGHGSNSGEETPSKAKAAQKAVAKKAAIAQKSVLKKAACSDDTDSSDMPTPKAKAAPSAKKRKVSGATAVESEESDSNDEVMSTSSCPRPNGKSELEHMRHWLLCELAKNKPVVAMGSLLEIGLAAYRHSLWLPKAPVTGLQELCSNFLASNVFKAKAEDSDELVLQDWCVEVLNVLPGVTPKATDRKFLRGVKNVWGSVSKCYCEILAEGTPGFHLWDDRTSTSIRVAVALVVSALQRNKFLDDQIYVLYKAEDDLVRIARGSAEKKVLVYGIGYPGCGKSTSLKAAMASLDFKETTRPVPLAVYENGIIMLGQWRDGLNPGTDALEYAAKPKVLEWMRTCAPGFIIAEGIRLLNRAFFQACKSMGYRVHIVHFEVPADRAQQRFTQRGSVLDKKKELWYKGCCTQVDNVLDLVTHKIDGLKETNEVAAELRAFIDQQFATVNNMWGDWSEEERKLAFSPENVPKPKKQVAADAGVVGAAEDTVCTDVQA